MRQRVRRFPGTTARLTTGEIPYRYADRENIVNDLSVQAGNDPGQVQLVEDPLSDRVGGPAADLRAQQGTDAAPQQVKPHPRRF